MKEQIKKYWGRLSRIYFLKWFIILFLVFATFYTILFWKENEPFSTKVSNVIFGSLFFTIPFALIRTIMVKGINRKKAPVQFQSGPVQGEQITIKNKSMKDQIKKLLAFISKNRIVIIIILVVFGLSYWFQLRPALIRKECIKQFPHAFYVSGTDRFNYKKCLVEHGLKE